MTVRVRFAPSPTGHLHIGGLRTALFNYLFARHHQGVYLVRIEDTDLERSTDEFTQSIMNSLAWTQLLPDEEIVFQSKQIDKHKKMLDEMITRGRAYYCICSQEEVLQRHVAQGGNKLFVKYDGNCRNQQITNTVSAVIRFALPEGLSQVVFDDLIRGTVTIVREQLDDFIIARSDKTPMYNFVVVVDDISMSITHVIRGEDHIINTAKQILLYQALEKLLPHFAHLPLILGPSGNRLSKREAATSVTEYKDAGYLPNALLNYLVRLGWSHGDQEIFTLQQMIDFFTLDAVGKKGAIFDIKKLDWLSSCYLQNIQIDDLIFYLKDVFAQRYQRLLNEVGNEHLVDLINLYKDRTATISQLLAALDDLVFGFDEYCNLDDLYADKDMLVLLQNILIVIENIAPWDSKTISSHIKLFAKKANIKLSHIMKTLRIALIGSSNGPGFFALISMCTKNEVIARTQKLIKELQQ
jgi:glutamyl-tRNA synthetase